ncbi:MAG: LacI family transcriptional regulator [Treponema sp.]|nr:LacI family transcriptional regulator [Treponema sp.]
MATREDVAKLARVSGATVSFVVNDSKNVSPEVRERVLAAIAELDYHPNLVGRSLVKKKTNHVAILVDNLRNPHYCEMLEGAQQLACEKDYIVSILMTSVSNIKTVADLIGRGVDGAILTQLETEAAAYLRKRMPCVGLDSHVKVDYRSAVFSLIECLKEHGHREIVFLGGLPLDETNARYIYFCAAMKEYGLNVDPRLVHGGMGDGRTDEQSGATAMKEIMSRGGDFTAVFALNDLMCIGAAVVLRAAGYKIPQDVSLAGCDNLKILNWFSMSLSSIEVFPFETGTALMKHLIETIQGIPSAKRVIKCEFLKKESITRAQRRLVSA